MLSGDTIVHTMGVSADPEMSEHMCDGNDLFLIIATDGIWDVIESAQAVQLVAQHLARATAQVYNIYTYLRYRYRPHHHHISFRCIVPFECMLNHTI
jgi:hypothetical protein